MQRTLWRSRGVDLMAVDEWLGWVGVKMKDPYQKHPKTSKNIQKPRFFYVFLQFSWSMLSAQAFLDSQYQFLETATRPATLPWFYPEELVFFQQSLEICEYSHDTSNRGLKYYWLHKLRMLIGHIGVWNQWFPRCV